MLDVMIHITNGSKRNSAPKIEKLSPFTDEYELPHQNLKVLKSRRDFQNRSNSRVSLDPSFRFRSWIHLEVMCTRDKQLFSEEIH